MGDPADRAPSRPASRHTIQVPGRGTATLYEMGGYQTGAGEPTSIWNWGCDRDDCGEGSLAIGSRDEAEREARWHLEHEHEPQDTCRPVTVDVDGQPTTIRVHGAEPLSDEGRAALGALVAAAQRRMADDDAADPTREERRLAAQRRNHARLHRLGMTDCVGCQVVQQSRDADRG